MFINNFNSMQKKEKKKKAKIIIFDTSPIFAQTLK